MAECLTPGCTVKTWEKGDSFLVLLLLDLSSLLARSALTFCVSSQRLKYLFSVELPLLKDISQPRHCICLHTGKIVDSTLNA